MLNNYRTTLLNTLGNNSLTTVNNTNTSNHRNALFSKPENVEELSNDITNNMKNNSINITKENTTKYIQIFLDSEYKNNKKNKTSIIFSIPENYSKLEEYFKKPIIIYWTDNKEQKNYSTSSFYNSDIMLHKNSQINEKEFYFSSEKYKITSNKCIIKQKKGEWYIKFKNKFKKYFKFGFINSKQ